QWLFSFILLVIPGINIIMLCIWSFGKKAPKTKENWAKACLLVFILAALALGIWMAVGQFDWTQLLQQG
ncbi:MAG: hypothetical protein ACRC9P_00675, partial [Bacteroides sp.]